MDINFAYEIKNNGKEDIFINWLFGDVIDVIEFEEKCKKEFGDLRDVIVNNIYQVDMYEAKNKSQDYYYPNIVVCDLDKPKKYKFKNMDLLIKFLYLVFNNILILRKDEKNEGFFIANNKNSMSISKEKMWPCGVDHQAIRKLEYTKGSIVEKDVKIFEFEQEFCDFDFRSLYYIK